MKETGGSKGNDRRAHITVRDDLYPENVRNRPPVARTRRYQPTVHSKINLMYLLEIRTVQSRYEDLPLGAVVRDSVHDTSVQSYLALLIENEECLEYVED